MAAPNTIPTSKITEGTVGGMLKNKTPDEKKEIKSAEHCKRPKQGMFTALGYDIDVSRPLPFGNSGILLNIRLWKEGKDVTPPNLNPVGIGNPIIVVPDGTKTSLLVDAGLASERTISVDNYKEDLDGALRQIAADHVEVFLNLTNTK